MASRPTFLQSASSATDSVTYTFASQNLGDADADRAIIVTVGARKASPSATIESASIGGVSAAIIGEKTRAGSYAGIIAAAVPTGTAGDIVITFSTGVLRCMISVYRTTEADDITTAFDVALGANTNQPSVSIDAPAGGFLVAAVFQNNIETVTWTGATSDAAVSVEGNTLHSASEEFASATSGHTVQGTTSSNIDKSLVVATWKDASGDPPPDAPPRPVVSLILL